jgi:hypothetical protein
MLQRKETKFGNLYLFLFQALFHETKERLFIFTQDNAKLKRTKSCDILFGVETKLMNLDLSVFEQK